MLRELTLAGLAFVALAALFETPARADTTPLAESLFQQGVAAMEQGDYARACALLAESQRVDPGGGTLLNLAVCHERAGRIATAWARYVEALGVARRDHREDRLAVAEERIRALEPRLPRLAVVLAEPVPGVRVEVDGVEVRAGAWEVASPVDPGEHDVSVFAAGFRPYTTRAVTGVGESARVSVPPLVREASEPARAAGAAGGGTRRTVGWALTGVGGGALVGSAVLGALAIGAESTADAACPGTGPCSNQRGLDASARATNLATGATITGIAGAVALLGGVILLLVR